MRGKMRREREGQGEKGRNVDEMDEEEEMVKEMGEDEK